MRKNISYRFYFTGLLLLIGLSAFAQFPPKPDPPRLVNDMAHMMTEGEQSQLERKLLDYSRESSNEITIVTINELGDYDVADYATKLGKAWGVGRSGRNNGVVILASLKDHKINISPGKGLEGALTDLQCGRIIRHEMVPAFKENNYYQGFSKAADAIIAATKGEYKGDDAGTHEKKHVPLAAVIILIILVLFIIKMTGRGGGGGGNYMSGGGWGNFATGMFLGNLLGGGFRGGGGGGGGGGDSGFGGFGGGDFGGGGASGDW